ncbi:uncharacterized protein LOC130712290 [Lotus japonicus]|uniref:uncharacterized protein LOC130712290 n=1 Tax=Lotus japonicus TaxID=34305 RepID=UPI00258493DB|nr:uncharacterized protein LOC130712290 [Lotus japonicus]
MAELLGVLRGLQLAWHHGYRKVVCESDSLSVVQTLSTGKSVNLHSCAVLLTEIHCMLLEDWEVIFKHVLRDKNNEADTLEKLGLEKKWRLTTWNSPPTEHVQLGGLV